MHIPPQHHPKGPDPIPPADTPRYGRRRLLTLAGPSALNVVRGFLPMAAQAVIAFLVLGGSGPSVWGQFVLVSVTLSILLHVSGFGNRDYLLQRFALEPSRIFLLWQRNLSCRTPLLAGAALIIVIWFYQTGFWFPLLWLLAGFLAQSVEASILHHRRIAPALGAELLPAVGLIVWVAANAEGLSAFRLVAAFALATTLKALLLLAIGVPPRSGTAASSQMPLHGVAVLRASVPFFLIGFGGLLHSRIDLFLVTALASDADLAKYQVSVNLFIASQAAFVLLLAPNAKLLQRLPYAAIVRIATLVGLAGAFVLALVVRPFVAWLLRGPYGLDLPPSFLWVGVALILPVWIMALFTYYLLGRERQTSLVLLSYCGAACNALLTVLLLPRIGILGALIGTAIAAWATTIGTFWIARTESLRS